MGRRYIYNKKKRSPRSRKNPNAVVLELENDNRLTVSSTSMCKSQDKDDGHFNGSCNSEKKSLVDLEQSMVLNVKKKAILDCKNGTTDKLLCESEPCESLDKQLHSNVLNKNIIKKIRIEPLRKNFVAAKPIVQKTVQQLIAPKPPISNLVIKNNPTFIIVSKTSINEIGNKPINLTNDIRLKQISIKAFEARMLNGPKKNIVRHKPILPKCSSNSIVHVKPLPVVSQVSGRIQFDSTLQKQPSLLISNTNVYTKNSSTEPSSYGRIKVLDKVLQATSDVQHEGILQKLAVTSSLNQIIVHSKESNNKSLSSENLAIQDNASLSFIEESTLNGSVLSGIPNEDSEKVYPVALKVNNFKDNGALQIFSNDSCSEDEMQILGI